MLLIGRGFTEAAVLDMPLNKFYLYVESAGRLRSHERQEIVVDLTASIQMALGGKGLKKYLKGLSGEDGD